jgi:DNA-binding NarL/FixJ family response regulator
MTDKGKRRARILIAEDYALVREGLQAMLAGEPDLEVVGEAKNGREAVEQCRTLEPDLVLMDVRMPEMDGLSATRAIKDAQPTVSILMVTTHQDPDYLLEAVRAGAAGYVLKEVSRSELLESIRRVLNGDSTLDHGVAMRLLSRLSREPEPTAQPDLTDSDTARKLAERLSNREIEALRLISAGKTNRQIAQELMVSLSTVKTYVQRIIKKLGVSDRTQAAVRAAELGLAPKEM